MKKVKDLIAFHSDLNDQMIALEQNQDFPNEFYQAFLAGENTLYQKSITENRIFDEGWIQTIESYFPSLNKICMEPKTALRYEQEVVAIEKAKKVGSQSIRHLASHTHYIREFKDDNVEPKRILITEAEIEYATYDNRFIKTLLQRLYDFVEHRFNLIKSYSDAKSKKHFNLESDFELQESNYKLTIDFEINEALENDTISLKNRDLLRRVEHVLKLTMGLQKSALMIEIKNAKPVAPPIMQTSVIQKNVHYRNAYHLWLYLDKYNILPYEININEQNLTFDRYYQKNVYQTALMTFSTVVANQVALEDHYQYLDVKQYSKKTPKVIKTLPKDLMTMPDPYTVEDTELNQYYLEQSKRIFERNLEAYQEETGNYDVSLRKAIKDTIQITNALFQSYFDFQEEDETDIFHTIAKRTTEEELLDVKQKLRIARIIRETKETDYKYAVRLEKKMMREVQTLDQKLLRETKKSIKDEAKLQKEQERLRLEKEAAQSNQEILAEHLAYIKEQNDILKQQHQDVTEQLKLKQIELKELEKETIEKEKLRAKEQYEKEVAQLKEKVRREKEKMQAQIKRQKEAERLRLRDEKQKMQIKHKETIELNKQKIKNEKQKMLEKQKKKLKT
jgi:DNA repair protein SbcC/Rad50